jgi:hypothetical protein
MERDCVYLNNFNWDFESGCKHKCAEGVGRGRRKRGKLIPYV